MPFAGPEEAGVLHEQFGKIAATVKGSPETRQRKATDRSLKPPQE